MRQSERRAVREGPKHGRRSSLAEMQARIDVLEAELAEAREQQVATAEVLGVINSSPGDLAPVFEAMLEKAMSLCGAAFGMLRSYDGEQFTTLAARGVPEVYARFLEENSGLVDATGTALALLVDGEPFVHSADTAIEAYTGPVWRALVDLGGARAVLAAPLRKDQELVGAITVYRQEARPFSDKQIALLQNFAAQAVIAIENARLLTETREALERQTATAEVLGVINSSPGNLQPVFDTMVEKATRLCGAAQGVLRLYDGEGFPMVACADPQFLELGKRAGPLVPGPDNAFGAFVAGERVVHLPDVREQDWYHSYAAARAAVDMAGMRSWLGVALHKESTLLGVIVVYRQAVRPFSQREIALLQNFAAQAVIAMENARLLTETREALEQQTATAEVLQVINSSPGDLAPVFDAMLEKATELCEAAFGVLRTWDGERFHFAAAFGNSRLTGWARERPPFTPERATILGRIVGGESLVTMVDALSDQTSVFREMAEVSGMRSVVTVALRKDGGLVGSLTVYRQEVRPFSDKQIALLQNFAAQAVVAMENARLLGELRERTAELEESLEHQTATSNVLQV